MKLWKKLTLAAVILACLAGLTVYGLKVRFHRRLDAACTDLAEVIDKLKSDPVVFDLADDRAVVSMQRLKEAAYTERQRKGVAALSVELGMLRACRVTKDLPGDYQITCLESIQKIEKEADADLDGE